MDTSEAFFDNLFRYFYSPEVESWYRDSQLKWVRNSSRYIGFSTCNNTPANSIRSTNVGSMLGQRRRPTLTNIGWTSRAAGAHSVFKQIHWGCCPLFFWSCVMLIHNTCSWSSSPLWNFRSMLLLSSHVLLRPLCPHLCSEGQSLLSCKVSSYCLLAPTPDLQQDVYLARISAMATRFSPNKPVTRYLGYLATNRYIRKERSFYKKIVHFATVTVYKNIWICSLNNLDSCKQISW